MEGMQMKKEAVIKEQILRNKNLVKNISLSFLCKIFSVGISFILIPILISYLNTEQYGIWLTILSILSWISFSDIGLGNGLRNKLVEAYSQMRYKDAKEYIATTYAFLSIIVLVIYVILMIIIPNLNWQKIFNTKLIPNTELIKLSILVTTFFLSNFVLSLYNQLFYAVQKSSVTGLGQILINSISLINLIILKNSSTSANLIFVSISYGLSLIIPSLVLTYIFFKTYKVIRPSIKDIKINKAKDLLNLGVKFFIIQIAVVVYFSTNNFIITQIKGPAEVGVYDTAFKLFNTITIVFGMLLTPLWSAFTEAYSKGDIDWIRKIIKKLKLLLIPEAIVLVLIVVFSKLILKLWIGNRIIIPLELIALSAIYVLIASWSNIYTYLMNGINQLDIQMYICLFVCIINIPLCFYFGKILNMGSAGVMLAQIITAIPGAIILPIKANEFMKKSTNGRKNVR
jgi:O-antigen/teichoic acid export membrane protein